MLDEMIERTSVRHHQAISRVSSHLAAIGIDYFCYQFVSTQGDWFTLGNQADWLFYCASHQTHRADPSLLKPELTKSGIYFPDTFPNPAFKRALADPALRLFDISQCLAVAQKTSIGAEYFFFAGSQQHRLGNSYVTNRDSLANCFPHFVRQELALQLEQCQEASVNLVTLKNPIFKKQQPEFFNHSAPMLTLPKLQQKKIIAAQHYVIDNQICSFTKREADCANALLAGHSTAKQIAKALALSHRTVDEYLTQLRTKLNVADKASLIRLLCLL